ncbi:MAG: DUF1648 domain-containing protein [Gemmatimonadota bacterium]
MTAIRRLDLALLAALIVAGIVVWPELPDRLPVHFSPDGTPDRWEDRGFGSWFTIPLVAVGLNLLVYGAAALGSRNVRLLNIPDKERLLRLPPDGQRAVPARVREGLQALALSVTIVFCLVQIANYRAAYGLDATAEFIGIITLSAIGSPLLAIALLYRVQREIDRQSTAVAEREADAARRLGGCAAGTGRDARRPAVDVGRRAHHRHPKPRRTSAKTPRRGLARRTSPPAPPRGTAIPRPPIRPIIDITSIDAHTARRGWVARRSIRRPPQDRMERERNA